MSLINDALKRAKRTTQDQRPSCAVSEPPLQPVAHLPSSPSAVPWLIAACSVLLLSCWCLSLWWQGHKSRSRSESSQREMTPVVAPATNALAASTVQSPGSNVLGSAAAPAATNVVSVVSIGTTNQDSVVSPIDQGLGLTPGSEAGSRTNELPIPPAATETPSLKLQGIFYRAADASVLINGQTLFVGDDIGGATIVSIERHAVRLVAGGKTNVLKLR